MKKVFFVILSERECASKLTKKKNQQKVYKNKFISFRPNEV